MSVINNPKAAPNWGDVTCGDMAVLAGACAINSADGSFTLGSNYTVESILIANYPNYCGPTDFPTTANPPSDLPRLQYLYVEGHDHFEFNGEGKDDGDWNADLGIQAFLPANPANCVSGGNPVQSGDCGNFFVAAIAKRGPDSTPMDDPEYEILTVNWHPRVLSYAPAPPHHGWGKGCCGNREASAAHVCGLDPIDVSHGWLHYSVDLSSQMGCRLMHGGQPLRARLLAVSAHRVLWKAYEKDVVVVRCPQGEANHNPKKNTRDMMHPHYPWHCTLITQRENHTSDLISRYVVRSSCPDHPDLMNLSPDHDVRVSVNGQKNAFSFHEGIVEIRVKVLDP